MKNKSFETKESTYKMIMKKRGGFVLIIAFLAIVLLLILSGVFVMSSLTEQRVAQRQLAIATAFYLAEAGIDDAIRRLKDDNMYAGTTPNTTTLGTQGEFETTVTQPVGQPNIRRIESSGYTPSKNPSAYGYQMKKIEAYVEVIQNPLFRMAILTERDIEIQNSLIDSYDSDTGAYDPNNPGLNGDIGSNNSEPNEDGTYGYVSVIDGAGVSTVKGDATVGPTVPSDEAISVSGRSQITGELSNMSAVIDIPPAEVPEGISNSGDVTSTSADNAQVYPGGTYWFSSIQISGQGSLTFTGAATVYVTGQVSIAGNGAASANNLPANLIINVVGAYDVNIMGNAALYAGIYAPESLVTIGGGGSSGVVYGSIVADKAKLMNAQFHHDEALREVPGGDDYSVTIKGWHESI